jgi:hypothetical protein
MKRLSTLDLIVRAAVILIVAGILYTGYMYWIGKFGQY